MAASEQQADRQPGRPPASMAPPISNVVTPALDQNAGSTTTLARANAIWPRDGTTSRNSRPDAGSAPPRLRNDNRNPQPGRRTNRQAEVAVSQDPGRSHCSTFCSTMKNSMLTSTTKTMAA